MLRIATEATATEQRWTLCGQLTGPWVAELRASWDQTRQASESSRYLIDLSDVTFIDEGGERLLQEMRKEGAEFLARGVDTRDILENLCAQEKRPLRRFLAYLEEMK
jgi:anti-anti-sigma regulatory factor